VSVGKRVFTEYVPRIAKAGYKFVVETVPGAIKSTARFIGSEVWSWTRSLFTRGPLRMPNVPWKYGKLPANTMGECDRLGNIVIQNGLKGRDLIETVRHEAVHRWLLPGPGALQSLRTRLTSWAYRNSQLLKFMEEALAETYATGNLFHGLAFPFSGSKPYVSLWGVAKEGFVYLAGVANLSERGNRFTNWLLGK
jgi:hypothetical protein